MSLEQDASTVLQASRLIASARDAGARIATAESCTGGLIAATLTEVPGASSAFVGGIVAYSNEIKISQLGVDPAVLRDHGAVAAETAVAMATGALARFDCDVTVAVTGIAGPAGGTDEKPVGTVHIATATATGATSAALLVDGDRSAIRHGATAHALRMLAEAIPVLT